MRDHPFLRMALLILQFIFNEPYDLLNSLVESVACLFIMEFIILNDHEDNLLDTFSEYIIKIFNDYFPLFSILHLLNSHLDMLIMMLVKRLVYLFKHILCIGIVFGLFLELFTYLLNTFDRLP